MIEERLRRHWRGTSPPSLRARLDWHGEQNWMVPSAVINLSHALYTNVLVVGAARVISFSTSHFSPLCFHGANWPGRVRLLSCPERSFRVAGVTVPCTVPFWCRLFPGRTVFSPSDRVGSGALFFFGTFPFDLHQQTTLYSEILN